VADVRRLRGLKKGAGFGPTLDNYEIAPGTAKAQALAGAIARLRKAKTLPLEHDLRIDFWGAEGCWAHPFATSLWLYYKLALNEAGEDLILMAVHNYVHEQ
jgi:hypothetical protein